MGESDFYALLLEKGGVLKGHFQLSSGLHSDTYVQCAVVLQYPEVCRLLGRALAERVEKKWGKPDFVVSPALGGILIGYEVASNLGVRFVFGERKDGKMTIRRNQTVNRGEKCVIVEDVITTGGSVEELKDVVESMGASVVGVASIVNRGGSYSSLSLVNLKLKVYEPDECPLCKKGIPVEKPGSRDTKV